MKKNSEYLTVAIEAALQAGDLLRKGFGTAFEISSKPGRHNLVTHYDKAAEAAIFTCLINRFPHHGFIGEEQGASKEGDIVWVVDPLDGTVNFAHGIPLFAVSIAAISENQVVAACIYQPMTQELFWAEKGKGAFLNGTALHVTTTKSLDEAMLSTGFPYNVHEDPLHCIETFSKMTRTGIPIRRFGSAAIDLAYVAAGRFDAYWEVSLQPWDFAAGLLLVEEAGGKLSHYDGSTCNPFKAGTILASNGVLHSAMQKEIG
ncbi:MAG TPA: inositol monophosphatase family protein [Rhabdochlamydiaceae bacterium]|jgi:myo-inositol-1(or 4)-monophosphatase|nr:inositol monophosphatase family protein [Rhabdochlamydiaceae bacterium]